MTVSSSRAPLVAEQPASGAAGPPLVLNLQALQGGTGYLLVPSGPAAAAAAAAVECEPVESPLPPVEDTLPPPPPASSSAAATDSQPWSPSADQDLFK